MRGVRQIYCCLCGGPFFEPPAPRAPEDETGHWLSYGVLWTTVHDLGNGGVERDNFAMDLSDYGLHLDDPLDAKQRRVVRIAASYREHHPFVIEESGEGALAFTVDDEKSPFYLALHKSCDQLAEKFINSATDVHDTFDIGSEDKATSFKQLWTVLFSRMPGAPGIEFALPHPQEYYGVECVQTSKWEPEDRNPEMGELVEADPIDVPTLTKALLENLIAVATNESQDEWCDKLVGKKEFPWLWDLDEEQVREKKGAGTWDWELLVRKLSKVDIHDPHDTELNLPLGLRNRQRIWRGLEEARAGDVERQQPPPRM